MPPFLRIIISFFSKEIALSKLKVLLVLPILGLVLTSFTFKLNWFPSTQYLDIFIEKSQIEILVFLGVLLLIAVMLVIDFFHYRFKKTSELKKIDLMNKVLSNNALNDECKLQLIDKFFKDNVEEL